MQAKLADGGREVAVAFHQDQICAVPRPHVPRVIHNHSDGFHASQALQTDKHHPGYDGVFPSRARHNVVATLKLAVAYSASPTVAPKPANVIEQEIGAAKLVARLRSSRHPVISSNIPCYTS